ncbi:MAG: OmpA family protein [Acidobacteriia bacterium]|nr:OmpA family protein [Terriglobia bacterium]
MRKTMQRISLWVMAGMLMLGAASFAQEKANSNTIKLATGQKTKVSGVIVQRDADSFVLRDMRGNDVVVKLSGATAIKEKKSNPFRGAKSYAPSNLVRGLDVDVEGLGDADGALAARDIKFTQTEYMVANSVETRVTPVEGRLSQTETRLTRSEENAQHLSGQVDELREVSNAARGGAKAAQETADSAVEGVKAAQERITTVDQTTNARITAVDDFEVKNTVDVHFKVGSAVLSPEAKTQLDQLVKEAQAQRGYVVEVTGFASAEGDAAYNRTLSQHRADAVVQYLADSMIPLRRIVTPFGFGIKMPVADNATRVGRQENRRVEVKILTSKGLAAGEAQGQGMAAIKNQK